MNKCAGTCSFPKQPGVHLYSEATTGEAGYEWSVGGRHQGGEVLEKPASVRSYDGADDCGGDGRGVPEVHTGE